MSVGATAVIVLPILWMISEKSENTEVLFLQPHKQQFGVSLGDVSQLY